MEEVLQSDQSAMDDRRFLQEKVNRLQTIKEAYRVLKPGGILLAAAKTRYASLLDDLGETG